MEVARAYYDIMKIIYEENGVEAVKEYFNQERKKLTDDFPLMYGYGIFMEELYEH
jgi:hypothetical protein